MKTTDNESESKEAIDAFRKSLEIEDKWNWESFLGLGLALKKLNKKEDAVDALQKSLDVVEEEETYKILGDLLASLNRKEESIHAYSQAKKLASKTATKIPASDSPLISLAFCPKGTHPR